MGGSSWQTGGCQKLLRPRWSCTPPRGSKKSPRANCSARNTSTPRPANCCRPVQRPPAAAGPPARMGARTGKNDRLAASNCGGSTFMRGRGVSFDVAPGERSARRRAGRSEHRRRGAASGADCAGQRSDRRAAGAVQARQQASAARCRGFQEPIRFTAPAPGSTHPPSRVAIHGVGDAKRARTALATVGLGAGFRFRSAQLSGGHASLACACLDPAAAVLRWDEPTSALEHRCRPRCEPARARGRSGLRFGWQTRPGGGTHLCKRLLVHAGGSSNAGRDVWRRTAWHDYRGR